MRALYVKWYHITYIHNGFPMGFFFILSGKSNRNLLFINKNNIPNTNKQKSAIRIRKINKSHLQNGYCDIGNDLDENVRLAIAQFIRNEVCCGCFF